MVDEHLFLEGNSGVAVSSGQLIAFLDDGAIAGRDRLSMLFGRFDDSTVVGVGGGVTAAWQTARPEWLPTRVRLGCRGVLSRHADRRSRGQEHLGGKHGGPPQ